MRNAILLGVSVLLLLAVLAPCAAADPRYGIEGFSAYSIYKMDGLNQDLKDLKTGRGGQGFAPIENALGGGVGVRCWLNPSWLISLTWEPLNGKSNGQFQVDSSGNSPPVGEVAATLGLAIDVHANSVQLGAARFWNRHSKLRLGVGGGIGYYKVMGNASLIAFQRPPRAELEGNNIGFQGLGMAEWNLNSACAVSGSAGYRWAKVDNLDARGDLNLEHIDVDYSGFMGRLGVAIYLPTAH